MTDGRAPGDAEGFQVVVAEDGTLPASVLAPLGLHPGEHVATPNGRGPSARPTRAMVVVAAVSTTARTRRPRRRHTCRLGAS